MSMGTPSKNLYLHSTPGNKNNNKNFSSSDKS